MKKHTHILLALSLILLASLACNTVLPQAEPTAEVLFIPQQDPGIQALQSEDDVPRITVAEAKAALDSGQATIVDVRATESFIESHASGAVSIPLNRFELNINTIPLEENE